MTSLPSGLASISARLDDTPQVRGAVAFGRMVRGNRKPGDSGPVFLTEISRQTYEEQMLHELGSDCGLFLVVEDRTLGTLDVLAKVPTGSALMIRADFGCIAHEPRE